MKKDIGSKGLIESCYYKLRTNRSLKSNLSNPLLVANPVREVSLSAINYRKNDIHYHNKTLYAQSQNKTTENQKLFIAKQLKTNTLSKQTNRIQDSIVVLKMHQSFHLQKFQNLIPTLKQERRKIFKVDTLKNHQVVKISQIKHKPQKILQAEEKKKRWKTQVKDNFKQIHIRESDFRKSVKCPIWKSFPSRFRRYTHQSIRNESNFSFQGWQTGLNEQQQYINASKLIHKKL